MNYRRVFAPGASYFFTLTLQDRRSDLLIRNIKELRIFVIFLCLCLSSIIHWVC